MSVFFKPHKIQIYAGEGEKTIYEMDFSLFDKNFNLNYLLEIQNLKARIKQLEQIIDNHSQTVINIATGKS